MYTAATQGIAVELSAATNIVCALYYANTCYFSSRLNQKMCGARRRQRQKYITKLYTRIKSCSSYKNVEQRVSRM